MRIGYLIGQFPLPTHTFLWRDVKAIERLGVEVDLVSTRRPVLERATHGWTDDAVARTTYLVEDAAGIGVALANIVAREPAAIVRCLRTCVQLEKLTLRERARVAALIPVAARLSALAHARGWTHLHVAFPADTGFLALFASTLGPLQYSLAHHGNSIEHLGAGVNMAAKWGRAVFGAAVTEKLRADLIAELGAAAPETILIASMGVDLDCFTRRTPYQRWDGSGPLRLFSCGRLVPDKGHVEVVRAVAVLVSRGIDARIRIAGGAPAGVWFLGHLSDVIRETGMQDRVTLLGAIAEDAVRDELEAAHAFVLATHDEGLGIAFAEAMAMEVPVVGTRVGGVPELITDGVEGLLVPSQNVDALATALTILLHDSDAAIYGRKGREKVKTRFTSDVGARVLVDELRRRHS